MDQQLSCGGRRELQVYWHLAAAVQWKRALAAGSYYVVHHTVLSKHKRTGSISSTVAGLTPTGGRGELSKWPSGGSDRGLTLSAGLHSLM